MGGYAQNSALLDSFPQLSALRCQHSLLPLNVCAVGNPSIHDLNTMTFHDLLQLCHLRGGALTGNVGAPQTFQSNVAV